MSEEIKILCVDDEKNVLKALRRLFMDEDNYEILVAESGEHGLAMLAEEEGIRMVISDYRMPEMNGVEFLRQVYEKDPDTIRIVLSGYADTASVVEAINQARFINLFPSHGMMKNCCRQSPRRCSIRNCNVRLKLWPKN